MNCRRGSTAASNRSASNRLARGVPSLLIALALLVAGCGNHDATPNPSASSALPASPVLSPTPSPMPTPSPLIVPVPTPFFSPVPAGPSLDSATSLRLQKILDTTRTSQKVPGMSAAVIFPDGEIWSGASGLAVVSTGQAATAETVYSVGSITKTFVAALVLRLAERGKLTVDDPLARFVPSFPNGANITIRELLNHTSGIQDLFSSPSIAEAILAQPARLWTATDVLAMIGKPYFAPGTGYHYSNTNYLLLGLVVEKLTGETLAAAISQEFLDPLGLSGTFVQAQEPPSGPLAHGYAGEPAAPRDVTLGSKLIPFNAEVTAAGGSGELASTAPDLVRWAAALYSGGVLDAGALASMVDVSPTAPYHPSYQYGLGFEEWTLAGRTIWGHRGHLDGFWASMSWLPSDHVAIVILANGDWADTLTPAASMVSAILGPAPSSSVRPSSSGSPAAPGD